VPYLSDSPAQLDEAVRRAAAAGARHVGLQRREGRARGADPQPRDRVGAQGRVNQVTPGLVRTELAGQTYGDDIGAVEATVPMGRLASPADVAAACLLLSGPETGYVTGAELYVDGGGEAPAFLSAMKGSSDG